MDKKKILVVDDTDWNRDLLVQLLEEDYTVLQAVDGEQGVKMTQEEKPDLILMDLGMPVMDGWEATRRIKANDALKQIPIIAVTSHAMVGDEIDARTVIAAQRRQQGAVWSWFLLVTATAVSVAANVWAAPPDPLSRTVHGIVPIVGFVQIKDICNGIRDRLAAVTAAGPVPAAVTASAPAASGPAAVPRVITVPVREPHAVPPRPAAPPAAAPKTPAPPRTPKSRPRRTAKTRVGDIALARHAKQIRPHVEANPKITGKQIGELLGTNDSYGRRVKRAVTG